uniref:histidine kinase n=1 Tax=Roseihalotalea indica TaxID=2867963 RepID=A0AA49JJE9_9BACT|nr:HAMP domain-containing sensor histidine kinase [Tunicatimonas sp. TK19036]
MNSHNPNRTRGLRWGSLQFKLSLLFAVLLLSVSGVYFYMMSTSSADYLAEMTQKRNLDLAASIAKELAIDSATNEVPGEELENLFHAAMIINPNIKLYMIGHQGEILTASANPGEIKVKSIDVSRLEAFIHRTDSMPIYGDDPRFPGEPKVFSATSLLSRDGSFHCYLYITLGSEQKSDVASIRQSHILSVLGRALLVTLAVTMIIGFLFVFWLTKDLKKVSMAVRQMAQGDYTARVHANASDEVNELAVAFNTMASKIDQAMTQLKQNDELRRELIANISHDLRTPLASVEGYVETILHKKHLLAEHEQQHYLETILKNTRRLGRLVADLFELSKLEARQTQAKPETFSLVELAHDILLQLNPKAQENKVNLKSDFAREVPLTYADISLIERVLQNLIENAIQYTPEGGNVTVIVNFHSDNQIKVGIADTGPGITEEDLRHIFDRFYRSSSVRAQSRGGLGLGLAIAKKIVELHHSQLQVQSKVGEGTTFWFLLPVSKEILASKPV